MKPASAGIDDQMNAALYRAAAKGIPKDYYEVLRQMEGGVGGGEVTPSGNTVLHVAALHGRKQFVENILQAAHVASSMLLARNNKKETALHCAAERGYAEVVSVIIGAAKKYEDVEHGVGVLSDMIGMTDNVKDTALHKAVRMGHLEVVRILVKEDIEFVYPANDDGETPIYIAAEFKFQECLVEMLNSFKSPTYGGPLGRNALHAAILSSPMLSSDFVHNASRHFTFVLDALVIKRLDKAIRGETIEEPSSKYIRRILESEISLCEKTDDFGWTPLHYAVKDGKREVGRMILERKTSAAYIRAGIDKEWTTTFHIAAREGNVGMMIEIEKSCPDCWEMMDSKGQNVLHEVVRSDRISVIKHIKTSNQLHNLVHMKDEDGNTPMHLFRSSNYKTIKCIKEQCPTLNYSAFNKKHQTLLDMPASRYQKYHFVPNPFLWRGRQRQIAARVDPTENQNLKNTEEEEEEEEEKIKGLIETGKTNIVVATLILTMTFAAGFAVPGGFNSEKGNPILLRKAAFKAFIITDSFSFLCSLSSISYHIGMVREASSSFREYGAMRRMYRVQNATLASACVGVVVAFVCGMYAILAFSRAFSITFLVIVASYTFASTKFIDIEGFFY